ncbi:MULTISPECIES: C4-dicarboxylate TRAP transporter substrate-binding protein [Fusobacterium]|uniref:C4-dicarboxylate TRAP transporter substrate-binding protein n=1 Tax=Fusobacterium TaxID=848 RepID=UPI001476D7DA|nr:MULTISPECIES: C4-dicarboxylate TRAP transporter substrate-binding protein [Fusobacterium]NME35851.1 TRAP transporter substrate-binding protein DctP [Fusobacterium sp. FSA-380-WT-3A]
MRKFKSLLLALTVGAFLMGCGGEKKEAAKENKPLEIRVSYIFKDNEPTHIAMAEAAENINKRLKGQVELLLFPNGQLPVYKDGLEQVVRGANFISVEDLSYIGDYVPEFTALAGPMLYESYDEYVKLMHTDYVEGLKKKAEEKGIKVLSLDYIFGFRSLITDKKVVEPKDLKGLKIRVPASKLFIDTLNAMGASAVSMPFGETISALQQGVIDGLEGSYATNYLTKTYELRKKMSLTQHFLGTAGVYISTKVWNSLTDEQRQIMQEEFDKAAVNNNLRMVDLDKELIEKLQAAGVEINEVNLPAFAKLTEGIYDNLGTPEGTYEKIQEELAKIRNEK